MVNKGRIHGELRNFLGVLQNLVKSDKELRGETRYFSIFFYKDKSMMNPRNQKSLDLDQDSRRNQRIKIRSN